MRHLFLLLLFAVTASSFAQTKKIAFKSHSGSDENFAIALENNLFGMENSNFGHAPQREVKTAQLDSVIFISDSVAIMVTSEYCTRTDRSGNKPVDDPKLWKAGQEKVYNHPLFSKKHSLDSIKTVLKEQYNFNNEIEKTVFVGYDNKKRKYKKNIEPVAGLPGDNNQTPFGPQFVLILSLIVGLSLLAAFISLWIYKRKTFRPGNNVITPAQ